MTIVIVLVLVIVIANSKEQKKAFQLEQIFASPILDENAIDL